MPAKDGTGRGPLPDLTHEAGLPAPVAGVDEVGRGAWAGPLVAAAAILDPLNLPRGIDDSKRLTVKARVQLDAEIRLCAAVGIGIVEAQEIDALGLTAANDLAMLRAVAALPVRPAALLVDGRRVPPGLNLPTRALVGGDALSASIAAASIVAKVARDAMMAELAATHPGYCWETCKGYGTRAHLAAIAQLGISPQHRMSFRPIVQAILEKYPAT